MTVGTRFGVLALAAIATLSIFAVACGDDDDDGDSGGVSTARATQPAGEPTRPPTQEAAEPTKAVGDGGTTISTTEPPEGGTFLVDADGFTLYIFDDDVAGSGASACTGACASAWPAATVSASTTPTASDDVTGTVATITRDDGTIQVTYKGKPLYRCANDAAPGEFSCSTVPKWTFASP